MTPEQRAWVRSPRGQLSLIGAVFAGSVLFSIGCALARDAFFAQYVYDEFEPVPAQVTALDTEQRAALPAETRRALYGQRIERGEGASPGSLLQHPGELHTWVRGTLVTGNPEQRREATRMLRTLVGHGLDAEVERSARYALARARATGDAQWEAHAQAVLDAL